MIERVIINAIVMGFIALTIFKWQLDQGVTEQEARNETLLLMVLFENVHVLNSRSKTVSIFKQYFFWKQIATVRHVSRTRRAHYGHVHTRFKRHFANTSRKPAAMLVVTQHRTNPDTYKCAI